MTTCSSQQRTGSGLFVPPIRLGPRHRGLDRAHNFLMRHAHTIISFFVNVHVHSLTVNDTAHSASGGLGNAPVHWLTSWLVSSLSFSFSRLTADASAAA